MRVRVVVTGIGMLCPLGDSARTFFESALKGISKIGPVTKFDASNLPVRFGGEIRHEELKDEIRRTRLQEMPRSAAWAVLAARKAVQDGELALERENPYTINVTMGVASPGLQVFQDQAVALHQGRADAVSPLTPVLANPAAAAIQISQDLGLHGEVTNFSSSCSSSASAIGYGMRQIQCGWADCVLAGGVDEGVSEIYLASFGNGDVLSRRNDDPGHASRPFDRQRDGYVLGDAACVLLLEEYERAKRRGAPIYCELLGYGATHDADSPRRVGRSEEAGAQAVDNALRNAGCPADEIDYYCAHGTSSRWTDIRETRMVKRVFRERAARVPCSSIKSMIGHPLGASGAMQTATAALAIRHQAIPPTINLSEPDPECDLDYVAGEAREARVRKAAIYSLGQGGSNTALILAAC